MLRALHLTSVALLILCLPSASIGQEWICDNGEACTSHTGTWPLSGAPDPYGADSVYGKWGVTYTWNFQAPQSGSYEFSMWWTEWPSRCTACPVSVRCGGQTVGTYSLNQQQEGGQWNTLDEYSLDAGEQCSVRIQAIGAASTCADAVRFALTSPEPCVDEDGDGYGDPASPSCDYPELDCNDADPDAYPGAAEDCENEGDDDCDGLTDDADPDCAAPSEMVCDNGQACSSSTGTWLVSGGANPYGANSLYGRYGATYTWTFQIPQTGDYDLNLWWTQWPSRCTSCPVTVRCGGQVVGTFSVNQQLNGGQWNLADTYALAEGQQCAVTIQAVGSPTTCADAVKLVPQGGAAVCGNGTREGGEDCDGEDDASCPGLCQPDCTCPAQAAEHIYAAWVHNAGYPQVTSMLQDLGATRQSEKLWTYVNTAQNKTYHVHIADDMPSLIEGLTTEGAHVIVRGHANYGLGPLPATEAEKRAEVIEDVYTIDDPRILNVASVWTGVSISGMIRSQAYPNWQPVFQDGASGIMPFGFFDPKGTPPYNYYITYQVPGDPTYYRIETVRESAFDRFPEADATAWFSSSGAVPNPSDPNHRRYYVTSPAFFLSQGGWTLATEPAGYYDDGFLWIPGGTGANEARWSFRVPAAGSYQIQAWWPASATNTQTARYTVHHATGTTTVVVNQRLNGAQWNVLGQFNLTRYDHAVILTDESVSGRVVADAIRIVQGTTYESIVDDTKTPYHFSRKTVLFRKGLDIPKDQLRYSRLFYDSCNVNNYFLDTFNKGTVFYTTGASVGYGAILYLRGYLEGKTDHELWEIVQDAEPKYDYYYFDKYPWEQ
ncbi:MAG: hypothetical protein AB1640_18340 [bacterium]